ncbi:MAG: sugar kinase [Solimonas sp.]
MRFVYECSANSDWSCIDRIPDNVAGAPLARNSCLPMSAFDVVTYGEAMAVFVAEQTGPLAQVERFTKRAAGAELNVAIGLARLGFRVGWRSRLGADSFGRFLLDTLAAEGLDASGVVIDASRPTGFYLKSRSDDGRDPQVEYYRKYSAASQLSLADYDAAWFGQARHVHLSGIGPALSDAAFELALRIAEGARQTGQRLTFDPNLRPQLWRSREEMVERLNRVAACAHWVMPGLEEGRVLTGRETPRDVAGFYLAAGAEGVVIKLGAQGAYVHTRQGEAVIPAPSVPQVVDTVGAGDGFAVGFISGLLEGHDPLRAAARGNWVGGLAIQVKGDSEGLPSRAQLHAFEAGCV